MTPRSFWALDSFHHSNCIVLAVLLMTSFLPAAAGTPQKAAIVFGASGRSGVHAGQPAGCPNQTGIITAISVPAGQPLALAILLGAPAPPGGVTYELASLDPTIAAAGDATQALLPQAFIPAGQTLSNTFLLYGVVVGSTYLEAISLTSGFGDFFTPVSVWDVNPDAGPLKFLDANPPTNSTTSTCRDNGGPNLSTDPTVLSTCGTPVQGGVADGTTQLLMRMVAGLPGTACYEIISTGPPDQGMIPTEVNLTQTVGSFDYGFSLYQVPSNYGDSSDSREVQVQFFYTPTLNFANTSTITASLTIVRPPLLLVHGIWSDPSTWEPTLWDRDPIYFFNYKSNYSSTNGRNYSTNFPKLQGDVQKALQTARAYGFAATQVDVTAHSMGGVLTRLYAGSPNFIRPDNFNLGDVHRLVTLDTPHNGSNLANLLVSLNNNSVPFELIASILSNLHNLFPGFTGIPSITQGAVCDLAENSPALKGLSGATNLSSQVITATGGPAGDPNGGLYETPIELLLDLPCPIPFLPVCGSPFSLFPPDVVDGFRFRENNDAIVPLSSEQGGLTAGTNFTDLTHTDVTGAAEVAAVVLNDLLDGPASGFASAFPPALSDGSGGPRTVPGRGNGLDQTDYQMQCSPGGPMNPFGPVAFNAGNKRATTKGGLPLRGLTPDPRVQVTSPTNGQQFAPGDTVNVTVQITSPLTAAGGYLGVGVPGAGFLPGTNNNGSSYQASFVIPNNFAGPIGMIPGILDPNGNPIEGLPVTIVARPTTPPLSLTLVPVGFSPLLSASAATQVYVTGHYPNGLQRDLTSSVTGTTYKSSNNSVLTVDTQGNVQANAFGTAVVTAQNSGLKAFASFDVEDPSNPLAPQDLTSNLKISRSGFRVDRTTGYFVQTVQITNAQAIPMIGPMYFTVTGLTSGVTMANSGLTKNIQPAGSPYVTLRTPDGIILQPGGSLSLTLQFLDPSRARINYTPKVFRTLSAP